MTQASEIQQAALLNLITPTGDAAELRGCDLIIEAVFEQRALKAAVTREAEPMLAAGGLFASNTSTARHGASFALSPALRERLAAGA